MIEVSYIPALKWFIKFKVWLLQLLQLLLKDRLKRFVGEIRFVGNLVAIGLDSKDLSTSAE